MAHTKINTQVIPDGTIVSADLTMPITGFSSTGIDDNATETAITIDSNEKLLIGNTSTGASNTGHIFQQDGLTVHRADNTIPLIIDRHNSDGDILTIRRQGAGLGGISSRGTTAGDLLLWLGSAGLTSDILSGQALLPTSNSASPSDDAVNLGSSSNRFKNLYLGGDITCGNLTSTGIDDNATSTALTIDSSGNVDISGNLTTGNNTDISMGATAPGQLRLDGVGYVGAIALDSTGMYIYHNSGSRSLIFGTNETERLRITSGGNVGIGTPNPSRELQIKLSDDTTTTLGQKGGIGLYAPSNTVGNGGEITWSSGVNSEVWAAISGSILANSAGVASGHLIFATADAAALPTERMRINSVGQVIIGEDASSVTKGLLKIRSDSNNHAISLIEPSGGSENWQLGLDSGGSLLFNNSGSADWTLALQDSGGMVFRDAGTDTLGLEFGQLAHNTASNLGVGIAFSRITSSSTLSAIGITNTSKLTLFSREGIGFFTGGGSGYGATAETVRIDTAGRVLINQTSPDESLNLEVMAPTGFSVGSGFHSGSTQSTISFKDTNTTADYKVRIGSEGDDLLMFAGTSERMRIASNGTIRISGNGSGNDSNAINFVNGAVAIARDDNNLKLHAYDNMIFGVSGTSYPTSTERMRITNAGKVGINTNTPKGLLTVGPSVVTTALVKQSPLVLQAGWSSSSGRSSSTIMWQATDTGSIDAFHADNTSSEGAKNFFVGQVTDNAYFNNNRFSIINNATEILTIARSGNVGIGTNDPWNLLTLKGGSYPTIALGETSTEMVYLQRQQINGGDAFLYNKGAGDLILGTNNQRRITVSGTSGNVGIGTSTPRSRLDLGLDSSGGTQISWHSSSTRSLGNIWTSNNGGRLTLGQALKGSTTSANGFLGAYTGTWAPSAIEVSYGAINIFTDSAQALTYGAGFAATRRAQFTNGTLKLENTSTSTFVLNIDDGAFAGRQALLPGRFVIGPPGNSYPDIGYNFKNGGTSAQTYYSNDTAWKQSFGTSSKMTFSHAQAGTAGNTISWNEVMHIHADNQVSIGKSTAQARFHVQGGDDWTQILENGSAGGIPWYIGSTANNWSAGASKFVVTSNSTSSAADFAIDSSGNAAFPLGGSAIASDAVTEVGVVLQVQGPIASGISQGYYNNTPPRHIANWFCYSAASNAGAGYVHMKTNIWAGGSPNGNTDYTMSLFTFRGYAYTGSNGVAMGMVGFHNWTGTLYNQNVHNDTSWSIAQSAYVSSDGYVVLVGYIIASYSFIYVDWNQWGGYDFRNRKVTASSHSSNATGVY